MRRILRHAAVTVAAIAVFFWLVRIYDAALRDPRFLDGWILTAGCLAQVLFSIRRKLPLLSLGAVSSWMQAHLYVGYFLVAVFALHTRFELPDGVVETTLWGLFVILVLSGFTGAYLSRTLPAKLAHNARPLDIEDIPAAQFELARRIDGLALDAANGAGPLSLSELYSSTLLGFLNGPRNILAHLKGSSGAMNRVLGEIDAVERHLDEGGKETLHSIRGLVAEKHQLDRQYAHQWLLRAWLFVHIPATYGMIVLALVHIAVVYAFTSGVP